MSNTHHRTHGLGDHPRFLLGATAIVLAAALWLSASAQAAYEQLPGSKGIFGGTAAEVKEGKFAEEVQLGGAGAMAVNRTGAGGVPKGTLYAVTEVGQREQRVAVYEPKSGGGMEFVEGWNVVAPDEKFERCGPLLGTEVVEGEEVTKHPCPIRPTGSVNQQPVGLDVDQSTGYVYVYSRGLRVEHPGAGIKMVVVYNADASEEITRFAETAAPGQTVAESPNKVHDPNFTSDMLAVNGAGEVYVFDGIGSGENFYARLMVFRPHEGDYKDYEYAGEVAGTSTFVGAQPQAPVFDEAGNLYVVSFNGTNAIRELAVETPGAYPTLAQSPRCSTKVATGGVLGMTVDPETGEPFYFSEKFPSRIRRFGPCDETTHEFKVEGQGGEELALTPEPEYLYALAVDPTREIGETRRDGVLYAASAGPTIGTTGHSALGYVFAHPRQLPPVIEGQSIGHVTATSTVACATVNPNGYRTHYAFQYESEAEYQEGGESFAGAKEAPLGGGDLEGTSGVQKACTALGPLAPATSYRFRVVVASQCIELSEEPCTDEGDAFAFSTYPASVPTLPDGRVWEMVSPAMKNGGQVWPAEPGISTPGSEKPGLFNTKFPSQASPDGEAVAYQGSAFGEGGTVTGNEYVARRNSSTGWQTTSFTPALLSGRYLSFDTPLGNGILEQDGGTALTPDAPLGYGNLYSQPTNGSLGLTPLLTAEPPHRNSSQFQISYSGASADQSRVFFAANDALTEASEFAPASADGGKSKFNLYEWHEGNLALVNVKPGNTEAKAGASFAPPSANPISENGTRAFWSDEKGQVYLREAGQSTKVIATEGVPDTGNFLAASKDGSAVLLNNGHLHYTEGAEDTVDLTEGQGGFVGVVGQADDLSHVYFVDTKVLDATPNGEGETAEGGANNLYAWQVGGSARFVGRLKTEGQFSDSTDWAASPALRTAEASPGGRFVAFISSAQLTDYDNTGPCKLIAVSPTVPAHYVAGPCTEVFLYDSQTDRLACASCNPSGSAPLGFSFLRKVSGGAPSTQPRYLTDSGRLFFDSEDSLSPLDTNEGVEDVYEFEPQGVGSCDQESGCVALISAGREAVDSNFVTMDEDGSDVFFTTRDRLVGKDTDELIDLYDARIGGGIAAETETQRGECQGEACQPPPGVPVHPTPATSAPAGEGNVKAEPNAASCRKGRTRSHGRCVKRHTHQKKTKKAKRQARANNDRGAK